MVTPLEADSATEHSTPESLEHYRQVIIKLLTEQRQTPKRHGHIDQQLVLDRERDHYLLIDVGWNADETQRRYLVLLHLDIIDGKIWLQQNATELLVEHWLVEQHVPSEAIVLGVQPSYKRPYTDYSVG